MAPIEDNLAAMRLGTRPSAGALGALVAGFASATLLSAGAEDDPASRILGAALSSNRAYETLSYLTDRIGPRLSGSARLERAVAWAEAELRRYGLDRVWTEPVRVPHWVRGVETGRIVSPVEHPLALTALGMSEPTPAAGITGEVVEVAGFEELRALGEKAKGKIVLFNRPIVPNGGEERGYGSAAGLRYRGAVEAAKQGAVGMLIRSLGTASYRLPHTGGMAYEDGVPRIPAAAIAAEDADLIHRLLAAGETVRVNYVLGCRTLPDADSANVLGEIRGREKPEEIVLVGAHLDSWDLGTGALDDGAGVAMVMETMRLFRSVGIVPRRTVRAVLFTNEENGLRGGRAYAETHREELNRHVAAIECDSGAARPIGIGVSAGEGGLDMIRKIAARLAVLGADEVVAGGGGADIGPLAAAGVPLLSLRQDGTRYFDYHHTAADTLDKVDPKELALNVAALGVLVWSLAEAEPTLARLEPGAQPRPFPAAPTQK